MSLKTSLQNIVSFLTEKFQYNALFRYRVSSDTGTKIDANSVVKTDNHPDIQGVEKVHGVPGITSTLQSNQQVLLAYEGGNPDRPYIVGFFAGVPVKLGVKVVDEMEVLKQGNVAPSSPLATTATLLPILDSLSEVAANLALWHTATGAVTGITSPTLLEKIGELVALIETSGDDYPIGIKSTALKSN